MTMVMLKAQPTAPLETIYEESGSFVTSTVHSHYPHHKYTNGAIKGLISARSVPPVNIQRQPAIDNQHKPPIEVRFRDGSKRFIQPSATETMIIKRRNFMDSSDQSLSSKPMSNLKYEQIFNTNSNKDNVPTKHPTVITIITNDDLKQAGVISTDSSSPESSSATTPSIPTSTPSLLKSTSTLSQPISSLSQSLSNHSQSILTQSQSTSTVGTFRTKKSNYKVSFAPLPPSTPVLTSASIPSVDTSSSTPLYYSPSTFSQTSHEQRTTMTPSQSSTPSQSISGHSNQFSSASNSKTSTPSLQLMLTDDIVEKDLSLDSDPTAQQTGAGIGGGTRSAFRPFHKPTRLNQKTFPRTRRTPLTGSGKSHGHSQQQQQQQMVPFVQLHNQQYSSRSSSSNTQFSIQSTPTYNEDPTMSTSNDINSSLSLQNIWDVSSSPGQTLSFSVGPNIKWYNVTSNNINDIPQLSKQYSAIPLRITIPVVTPLHNQKLVARHNLALEQRLLNAGLSPETVALYERILDVAGTNRHMSFDSPSNITDPYSNESFS